VQGIFLLLVLTNTTITNQHSLYFHQRPHLSSNTGNRPPGHLESRNWLRDRFAGVGYNPSIELPSFYFSAQNGANHLEMTLAIDLPSPAPSPKVRKISSSPEKCCLSSIQESGRRIRLACKETQFIIIITFTIQKREISVQLWNIY